MKESAKMGEPVRAIETTGVIEPWGQLRLDTPLAVVGPGRVRVIVLFSEGEYEKLIAPAKITPVGVPGKELLRFAGTIEADDLRAMAQVIEEGCEQVDLNEW
jgi:hypothetical protein